MIIDNENIKEITIKTYKSCFNLDDKDVECSHDPDKIFKQPYFITRVKITFPTTEIPNELMTEEREGFGIPNSNGCEYLSKTRKINGSVFEAYCIPFYDYNINYYHSDDFDFFLKNNTFDSKLIIELRVVIAEQYDHYTPRLPTNNMKHSITTDGDFKELVEFKDYFRNIMGVSDDSVFEAYLKQIETYKVPEIYIHKFPRKTDLHILLFW
jgi:hypothetical protein